MNRVGAWVWLALAVPGLAEALEVRVRDAEGRPIPLAMVTLTPQAPLPVDRSDNGYAQPGKLQTADVWRTQFSDAAGHVMVAPVAETCAVRVRKPGFQDAILANVRGTESRDVTLLPETDPTALAAAKPANVWAAAIDLKTPGEAKQFRMQCGFCHQQGTSFVRSPHTAADWSVAVKRMVGYGARLATSVQNAVPEALESGYTALRAHPEKLGDSLPWQDDLARTQIEEWPLGDIMSQMHDMLVHDNGLVYVGDNLQDRLYEVDPRTGKFTVYKLPRERDDTLGGMFAARLANFPKHESYLALHSLAQSAKDGHIFMTPSIQRRIIEFDPKTKAFTVHHLKDGLYPHTIRVDAQDRVWFTLALSNQVGMIDRKTGEQYFIALPNRSFGEAFTIAVLPLMFKLATFGLKLSSLPIDEGASGTPLPYGIDITPDGTVWVARLHAKDIARIDPVTLQPTMIAFPAVGPRRLRTDAEGNVWISAFAESAILRYAPKSGTFERFDMPTLPKGSDTPYSLNVDRARRIVWVTGTASDTLNALHMDTGQWTVVPLPHRMTFTRDIEIASDGSVYTANGAFPAWHVEGAQPTLLHILPSWATPAAKGTVTP